MLAVGFVWIIGARDACIVLFLLSAVTSPGTIGYILAISRPFQRPVVVHDYLHCAGSRADSYSVCHTKPRDRSREPCARGRVAEFGIRLPLFGFVLSDDRTRSATGEYRYRYT